jgi:type IV secretory pathway VirB6-like protein
MNIDLTIFGNALANFRDTIFQLFTNNANLFQTTGLHLFTAIATIMIVIGGVRIAFGGDMRKFAILLAIIAVCHVMIADYAVSIPFFGGQPFYQIVPNFSFYLADTIGTQTQQDLTATLNQIINGLNAGTPLKFALSAGMDLLIYIVLVLLIAILELAMFVVVAFGYAALGVTVLFGPILIPFILVPKLDFLFWGWFKALLKFSFYPAVANAFLFLIAKLMLTMIGNTTLATVSTMTAGQITPQFPILVILFAAGIYGCFKIPSLVNDLFSGAASSGGANGLESAARMAIMAGLG